MALKPLKILVLAALICVSAVLSSCTTTGNPTSDISGFFNSTAVQAELQKIRDDAFAWVNSFISSHLGATESGKLTVASPSVTSAIPQGTAEVAAKHPGAPKNLIEDEIRAAFAQKLK